MADIDKYLHAATKENTRRSYQSAIEHYEVSWGGFLPATADNVAQYLADQAETLSINTLKQRLAGLAQWHQEQGFPDPTKASVVKQVIKGIRSVHPYQEKQEEADYDFDNYQIEHCLLVQSIGHHGFCSRVQQDKDKDTCEPK